MGLCSTSNMSTRKTHFHAYDLTLNRTAYTANRLNQYTAEGDFRPTFDADGNQTLIKTSTGIWNVTYNAKNRPTLFTKSDGSVTVECTYDTMGRRATKKVTTNGSVTEHRRFLYRGYLRIDSPPPHRRLTPSGQSRFAHCPTGLTAVGRLACCDLTRAYTPALWYILWDPTQPTATRPLAIQKNGTWYTYGWDLTKNICETYRTDGRIDLAYTYTPYGEVSPAHTYDQPLRWSSEYQDVELGLVYYNYRHYNPAMGRWMGRDEIEVLGNLMGYCHNSPILYTDFNGTTCNDSCGPDVTSWLAQVMKENSGHEIVKKSPLNKSEIDYIISSNSLYGILKTHIIFYNMVKTYAVWDFKKFRTIHFR